MAVCSGARPLTVRILHILHQFLPDHVGGTEHYVHTLALAQQQANHEVVLFYRRSGQGQQLQRDMVDGLPVYQAINGPIAPARRFLGSLRDPFLSRCLVQVLHDARPDLVHVHHLMGLPAQTLLGDALTTPLVVTLHDYWWICANAQSLTDYSGQVCDGPRWWLNCARCGLARVGMGAAWPLSPFVAPAFAWRAAVLRRLRRRVAAWIAPTGFVRDWYVSRGLPAQRMHVVGHGIEAPPPESLEQAAVKETGEGASHVSYVGGLAQQKGVHILVDAFSDLPHTVRLTIAGDETAFPEYCADLHRRASHPGIVFVGRLDRTDVWRLLAQSDIVVIPSLSYETASLVVQEAFAVGTPVIASNHGALAETVQHEVNGLLFPPGDSVALRQTLQRLMTEPSLLSRLRQGISPPMDMATHVARIEDIYQQVLGLHKAGK
jgi:glycosyltransferase involved in cell wall biosynthesis